MSISLSGAALETVKLRFFQEGISVVDWATAHGFDVHLVYGVLSGRSRASRGESHRIAVALGLKEVAASSLMSDSRVLAVKPGTQEVSRANAERRGME